MSAATTPRRGTRTRIDRVRIVLPINVYGDAGEGKAFAKLLGDTIAKRTTNVDVAWRSDTGIVVKAHVNRGKGPTPAGAVFAAGAVLGILERALEELGARNAHVAAELERAIPYTVIKVNVSR